MSFFRELLENGKNRVSDKTVVFCGIVRDCESELKNNIKTIERIGAYFKNYKVIVFENNSVDNTKQILKDWVQVNNKIVCFTNDVDESMYMQISTSPHYYSAFSKKRITKMVDYRNLYLDYIEDNNLKADYLTVVDLDVSNIDIEGFLSSFGYTQSWDAIAANSKSISPKAKERYHDTYALTEWGFGNRPQTEKMIDDNRYIWSKLSKNMPLIKVFSAYGGLAIYRWEAIHKLKYQLIENNYGGVEVKCEHFSIYNQMINNGFDQIYINPNMIIDYQKITIKLIIKKIKEKLRNFKTKSSSLK